MMMTDISKRLQEINDNLTASCGQKRLSFGEALCLALFYRDFKDTNVLVEEAESLAGKNAARLHALAHSLLSEAECYLSLDKSAVSGTDYATLFESHLKPFEGRFNEAKAAAARLWREYSDKNNRLDYLPMDSDEYESLDAECSKAKEEYDHAHAEADLLYSRPLKNASLRDNVRQQSSADFFNKCQKSPHGSFEVVCGRSQKQVDSIPEHTFIKVAS